mmetsp:Transcript_4044/g.6065  ORF Transcript_4044/g.6065 Transcript_4044/m.6065 type:complete len:289 (+) Transcript_4044:1880-2746(+)
MVTVTTATRPSGITETASEIPVLIISSMSRPITIPTTTTITHRTTAINTSHLPRVDRRRWRMVVLSWVFDSAFEIFPTSECLPVATTIPRPRPFDTAVLIKHMFLRSPIARLRSSIALVCLLIGIGSPVKIASTTCRLIDSHTRKSAGIWLPSSRTTMSPGTSWVASMTCTRPSRSAMASCTTSDCKAASVFSALYSCVNPIITFVPTTINNTTAAAKSPKPADTQPAIIKITTIKSVICVHNIFHTLGGSGSGNTFGPYCSSLSAASSSVSPSFKLTLNTSLTTSTD